MSTSLSALTEQLAKDVARLTAEVAALKQDAARYRWLRSHWYMVQAHTDHGCHAMVLEATDFTGTNADNLRLDAEIDAAMPGKAP